MVAPPNRSSELHLRRREQLVTEQIMRSERRMEIFAAAINEFVVRIRKLDRTLPGKGITQEIEPMLGSVVLRGNGDLHQIKLDVDRVRTSDPAGLGERILHAIEQAEAKAKRVRAHGIREIRKSISWE